MWRDACLQVAVSLNVCHMIILQPSTEKTSETGAGKNASIQDCRDKETKKPEEDEIQYAIITVHHPATEAK